MHFDGILNTVYARLHELNLKAKEETNIHTTLLDFFSFTSEHIDELRKLLKAIDDCGRAINTLSK